MLDVAIRGGVLVDGTGSRRRHADVGILGGRVVETGPLTQPAKRTIDAAGLVVAPGFVDVHTHVDAQVFWDPFLTPSSRYGITTVIGGNCGFTLAPLDDRSADYLIRMLAVVEGMPLAALQASVPANWRSFGQYLDRIDGTLALNAGFAVGHSALRRVAMGTAATQRPADAAELERMKHLLRSSLSSGALGFSSSWGPAHHDGDGQPVPSRCADVTELVELAGVCGEFDGTTLEFIPPRVDEPDEPSRIALTSMALAARRRVNWNTLRVSAATLPQCRTLIEPLDVETAVGAQVVALQMPIPSRARFSFLTGFVLDALPGWQEAFAMPPEKRQRYLESPEVRRRLTNAPMSNSGLAEIAQWDNRIIDQVFTPALAHLVGRNVGDLAAERGVSALEALLDVACADELRTTFTRAEEHPTRDDWLVSQQLWSEGAVVIGASDAGAHLDFTAYFDYPAYVLQHAVRHHGAVTLEAAVRQLTSVPADLYGLRDRGRLLPGAFADLVVFDPERVACGELRTRFDLPTGAGRLYSEPVGVHHVLVNGCPIVLDSELTGALPGTLLRSGRDTATPI